MFDYSIDRLPILGLLYSVLYRYQTYLLQGLCTVAKPVMTAFAIGSNDKDVNIQALADVLETKGTPTQ